MALEQAGHAEQAVHGAGMQWTDPALILGVDSGALADQQAGQLTDVLGIAGGAGLGARTKQQQQGVLSGLVARILAGTVVKQQAQQLAGGLRVAAVEGELGRRLQGRVAAIIAGVRIGATLEQGLG